MVKEKKKKNKQDKSAKPDERLEVGQYTGSVPDIDLEAAKERAREYDKKVLRPEKEKEIRDSQEKYKELIDTEKDFLDFFNEDKYKFQVEYKGKLFDIEITYIDPEKNDLSILEMDTGEIFSDLDSEEQKIIMKMQDREPLTPSEQERINNLSTNPETAKAVFKNMNKVLTQQVIKPNISEDQWNRVDLAFRLFVYQEVMDRLGLSANTQPRLFQAR